MLRLTGFFIILFTPAVFFMSSFFSVFFSTEYQIGSLSYVDNFGKKDTNAVLLLQPNKAPSYSGKRRLLCVSIPLLGDGYYRYQKIASRNTALQQARRGALAERIPLLSSERLSTR